MDFQALVQRILDAAKLEAEKVLQEAYDKGFEDGKAVGAGGIDIEAEKAAAVFAFKVSVAVQLKEMLDKDEADLLKLFE